MRLACVCLAVLMVAACPPRRARVAYSVQPRAVPSTPIVVAAAPVVPPPVAKPTDPEVEKHLTQWEKRIASLTNFRTEIGLTRTDAVFKKATTFSGFALFMKPNYAQLRLDNTADPTNTDYEAYICNGKAVFVYNGAAKTVAEITRPAKWPFRGVWAADNPVFALLTGMKAQEMIDRFDVAVLKTDDHHIYLGIKPVSANDQRELQRLGIVLYGPGPATAEVAYLPAQVYILKPNGDTEVWKFTSPRVDVPGVDAKHFQYVEVKDKTWKFQKAQPEEGDQPAPVKP